MPNQLSRITTSQCIPALRKILAAIETGDIGHPKPDSVQDLRLLFLEKECEGSTYIQAMDIIKLWLAGSKFDSDFARIWKLDPKAKWEEIEDILRQKMLENAFDVSIIQLTISRAGFVFCMKDNLRLECDLKDSGLKLKLLRLLAEKKDAISTKDLCKLLPCKTAASLSDHKRKTNLILQNKLILPRKVIVRAGSSSYYIDPFYQVTFL